MLSLTRICSGEVAITVWTRPRLANFTASAQRSMSFGFARDRPAITAFLERLAISLTAWKSPSEVIGKPASMTSTPMSSSISATSIFSSKVMVAPGHCSPSRKVVSNIMTRSLADLFTVQYNKAIVGRNAFAHESGIHQDGVLKDASTYEIMRPEMVGLKKSSLVLGKHSGRHAFIHKLEEMGYKLGANQLEDAFVRMKALADRKKDIYDEDIEALVDQEIALSLIH